MKDFKEFLNEGPVLKLRGFGRTDPQSNFMRELNQTSQPHPFNDRERIVGNSTVHMSPNSSGGIHLHDIMSLNPKSGAGTETLKHLTALADKHNVHIEGIAKVYHNDPKRIGKTSRLKTWYEKHGFKSSGGDEHDGYDIRYDPK